MIRCTYGDLEKLRDLPGRPGVLTKLNNLAGIEPTRELPSVVDRWRLARFVRLVGGELMEYTKVLVEIGKKYGKLETSPEGFVVFSLKPEDRGGFDSEKATLESTECEIPLDPLPLSTYEKIPLTPRELAFLEKFVVVPGGV